MNISENKTMEKGEKEHIDHIQLDFVIHQVFKHHEILLENHLVTETNSEYIVTYSMQTFDFLCCDEILCL